MKNAGVIENYNRIFADDDSGGLGERSSWIVEALPKFISSGNVLDIGPGRGGNSLYLASQGFNVTASDISSVAIQKIIKKAEAAGIPIQTQVGDFTEMDLKHEFDVIVCTFVMHHFSRAEAERVIKKMQQSTKQSGFNIITSFTKKGDCLKRSAALAADAFYLDSKEELEGFYSNWNHISRERKVGLRQKGPNGETLSNECVDLFSQKTKDPAALAEIKKVFPRAVPTEAAGEGPANTGV
jgi:tellurite methyltransferase